MAKKKSLKAKLAKKAKASTQSPNRNGSPANPEPSTSKHNTEQAPKEKSLLGPSISSIKSRPLLRRDPAVSKKAKKFVKDPRLIPRIMEHLETHKTKNFVSIPLIAEELQKKYPEYARKKKSAFMQYVDRVLQQGVDFGEQSKNEGKDQESIQSSTTPDPGYQWETYCIIADPGSDESELDSDDDSDEEGFFPEEAKKISKDKKKKKKALPGTVNGTGKVKSLFLGTAEMTVPDVDDMPDEESYTSYPDTNAMNSMMSNMYRMGSSFKRSTADGDEPPSKLQCVEEKKFVEKIMYPSPDVLKKLKKDSTVPKQKNENGGTVYSAVTTPTASKVYTAATTAAFYIDKTGTTTSINTSPTTTVTSVTATSQDSRESNIQKFLGNLPSRVAAKPVPPPRPDPPPVPAISILTAAVPIQAPQVTHLVYDKRISQSNEPSPSHDQRRLAARQRHLDKMRHHHHGNDNSRDRLTGTPTRQRRHGNGDSQQDREGPVIERSTIKFADVGGNEASLKEICKLMVHMRHPEVYRQLGVTPPRGFLLHGPPGCGKTLLANAIAGELDLPYIKIAATEIVSGVSGNSEEKIRGLFDKAVDNAPCVLFIDEIDSITPKRETASKEMERRIVSQLIACLDDLNTQPAHVLVIGATNRPDSLDPALRRAGRFDREISLGIPDEQSRKKILEVLCRELRLSEEFDYGFLAHNTPGFVGADLMALTREAAMTAVNRVFCELQGPYIHGGSSQSLEQCVKKNIGKQTDSLKLSDSRIHKQGNKTVTQSEADSVSTDNVVSWTPDHLNMTNNDNSGASIVTGSSSDLGSARLTPSDSRGESIVDKDNSYIPGVFKESKDGSVVHITEREELLSVLSWLKEHPPLTEEQLKDLFISLDDFKEALKHVQPSAKREGFATIPGVTWNDIGALHEVREELQLAILAPVRHAEQFKNLGLNRAQGILLAGPPGCGKTLLAKAVANESGINFISVKGPELLNMYVGESEKAVRTVFQRARNSAPCVIFFDELDALCPRRSDHGEGGSSVRVVNQLLTEMDGLEDRKQVFIMAATNRPDIIDPAVMRPGRLDKTLYVGLPSVEDRLDILKCITQNGTRPQLDSETKIDDISKDNRCEGYTGADLAALVREASIAALKQAISAGTGHGDIRVSRQHFDMAFTKVKPSVSAKDQEQYKNMKSRVA